MAKIKTKDLLGAMISGHLEEHLSGKLGDKIYVARKGKPSYVRSLPRKREAGTWSEKQLANRQRFLAITRYAQRLKEEIIEPIWNQAAVGIVSGYSLFIKANSPAFDALGQVNDPYLLRFSTGKLSLPPQLEAATDPSDKNTVLVSWYHSPTDHVHANDLLWAAFFDKNNCQLLNTGIRRKEIKTALQRPFIAEESFVALFFSNQQRLIYSDDRIFKLF